MVEFDSVGMESSFPSLLESGLRVSSSLSSFLRPVCFWTKVGSIFLELGSRLFGSSRNSPGTGGWGKTPAPKSIEGGVGGFFFYIFLLFSAGFDEIDAIPTAFSRNAWRFLIL